MDEIIGYGYAVVEEYSPMLSWSDKIKETLLKKYEFRNNEILNQVEFCEKDSEVGFHAITSYDVNSMLNYLRKHEHFCKDRTLKMLLNSDFIKKCNPIIDYISHLPKWDEVDHIGNLAKTITTNDEHLFSSVLQKFFIAMVKAMLGVRTNLIIINLVGSQSFEIAAWIRKIVPDKLEEYYYEGIVNVGNLRDQSLFAEKYLVYIIEYENMTPKKQEELKSFIASTRKIKKANSKNSVSRKASVICSMDKRGYVKNEVSGNRRFFCFEIESIDSEHNIPVDMLFAQALAISKNTPSGFNLDEIEEVEKNNVGIKDISIEDLVSEYIVPCGKDEQDAECDTPTNILTLLLELKGVARKSKSDEIKLGKTLSGNGFEFYTAHGGQKRYYYKLRE